MPKAASSAPQIDVDTLMLIIVGAHPRAELSDRPTAYRLRHRLQAVLEARASAEGSNPELAAAIRAIMPLVVTDVWYLNDSSLRRCPSVSLGGPGVNAVSAFLGDKLPSALVVDDVFMIQLDVALDTSAELAACCWGVDGAATASATDVFMSKYLDDFVAAAVLRMTGAMDAD